MYFCSQSIGQKESHGFILTAREAEKCKGAHKLFDELYCLFHTDDRNTFQQVRHDSGTWPCRRKHRKDFVKAGDEKPGEVLFYILYMTEIYHHQSSVWRGQD